MSDWYTTVLFIGYKDEDKIVEINNWLDEYYGKERYEKKYRNFCKYEGDISFNHAFYGLFNYFPLEEFIDFLKTIDWYYEYRVQLLVIDETSMDRYKLINLEGG